MGGLVNLRAIVGAALLASAPAEARAATPPAKASGTAVFVRPLTLLKRNDLDFGAIVASTTAGTVTLNPATGTLTATGGLVLVPGATSAGRFVGAGTRNTPINIRIPNGPVTLTRVGGTQTMTVTNWTLDGAANRRVPPNRAFEFRVGGRLNVAANQMDGTYVGSFDVTVHYP